jgi:hypothetical protein
MKTWMQNLHRVYRALEYKLHPVLVFIDAHILDKRTRLNTNVVPTTRIWNNLHQVRNNLHQVRNNLHQVRSKSK